MQCKLNNRQQFLCPLHKGHQLRFFYCPSLVCLLWLKAGLQQIFPLPVKSPSTETIFAYEPVILRETGLRNRHPGIKIKILTYYEFLKVNNNFLTGSMTNNLFFI